MKDNKGTEGNNPSTPNKRQKTTKNFPTQSYQTPEGKFSIIEQPQEAWYRDENMNRLLTNHLNDANYFIMGGLRIEDEARRNEYTTLIINEFTTNNARTILLPINLNDNHWVGAIFHRNLNGDVRIIFQDPLGNAINQNAMLMNFIKLINEVVNPEAAGRTIDVALNQQQDHFNCGVWTVENLIALARAARANDLPNNREGIIAILNNHATVAFENNIDLARANHRAIDPAITNIDHSQFIQQLFGTKFFNAGKTAKDLDLKYKNLTTKRKLFEPEPALFPEIKKADNPASSALPTPNDLVQEDVNQIITTPTTQPPLQVNDTEGLGRNLWTGGLDTPFALLALESPITSIEL